MDPRELNHLFEQMSPAPEQEEAILARLQAPEKAVKNPSRRWKKSVFVLTAAAAMALACAAAAFSALDPRLLSFFQRTPQDTEPLGEGVVAVDQSHTYENGWTVSVRQALADRYSLTALVEVTAPEGTALYQEHHNYYFDLSSQLLPEAENAAGVGGWRSGSTLLADDDPTDNQLTFLWYRSPTSYLEAETETFTGRTAVLSPSRFWSDVPDTLLYWKTDFPLEEWSCTVDLPAEDSGREVPSRPDRPGGGGRDGGDPAVPLPHQLRPHPPGGGARQPHVGTCGPLLPDGGDLPHFGGRLHPAHVPAVGSHL